MEKLTQLLKNDTDPNKPKTNTITKKFLKWNRKQIRDKKTTYYADTTKFYNLSTGRTINKPIDKRNNKLKKSFIKNNDILDSVFTKKDKNRMSFRYVFNNESNNPLQDKYILEKLIYENEINGNYRLIFKVNDNAIIDRTYNIDTDWWNDHFYEFLGTSPSYKFNDPNKLKDGDVIHFIFTKEKNLPFKYYKQNFLDGVNHCFFHPILEFCYDKIENTKSKNIKMKYITKMNIINGKKLKSGEIKKGLIKIYNKGIPEDKIAEVCELLQIGVDIEQPFNTKKLYEYRSQKMPLKVFKFINTRLDHIEKSTKPMGADTIFKGYDAEEVSKDELIKIHDELKKNNEMMIFTKNCYGIIAIRTLNNFYKLPNDFNNACYEFEKETGLDKCNIDYKKYPQLENFIDNATHFNGTIDFRNTEKYKKNIPCNIRHIDMKKAYTRFKDSIYYNGFLGKITDFRKVNNYKEKGLYYIDNINVDNCDESFLFIIDSLRWFDNNNIYADTELQFLEDNGAKFDVIYGAYGNNIDFEFNDTMTNDKELIKAGDNEFEIAYYAKYTGKLASSSNTNSFYMYGNEKFFETLQNNTEYKIDYNYEDKYANIKFDKKYKYSKKHISSQILAYQRLIMAEQLLKMDYKKLVRICVDGIYYEDHEYNIMKSFSHKTKMTFNNSPCESYLSNIFRCNDTNIKLPQAEPRDHYLKEIFIGPGGTGKTHINLNDTGFINTYYIPHSWKLCSEQNQHNIKKSVHHYLFNDSGDNVIERNGNVLIIDECSMLTEKQKEYILNKFSGKIIFLGDIGYQAKPIEEGIEMTVKGFDNVIDMTNKPVYRFKDSFRLDKLCKDLRSIIKSKKNCNVSKCDIQRISKPELKEKYKVEDMILCYHKDNEYNKVFSKFEKYLVTNNTRDYKNGQIVYDKNLIGTNGITGSHRIGYTTHSVQGSTFSKGNLYIDYHSLSTDIRLFYTAVSRGVDWNRIFIIM